MVNEALGKIRAALKGIDLLGAEAIELKPGSVVLVVLRHPVTIDRPEHAGVCLAASAIAEDMQREGVRAVARVLPEGFDLSVIEVGAVAEPVCGDDISGEP